jgi:hypothetical protein
MKFSLKALAAAAMLALPTAAQAQIDASVPLSIVGHPYPTAGTNFPNSGSGGGFFADFVIDFPGNPGAKFNDWLIWCIDPNRQVSVPGGPYTYSAYKALDFAQNTTFGGINGYNVSVGDMKKIVFLTNDLITNWAAYNVQQRRDRQGSIWALFRGEAPVMANIADANIGGWLVLFNNRNQTFVTYVPEPADMALIVTAIGAMAMLVMMRRRRV